MPINAYTGLMGSGKSYECVAAVIIPAIRNGRRVVTNVDGIDGDAIRAYCHEKWTTPMEQLGTVVHCKNDEVSLSTFLPYGESVDTFCKPGDIICIDEAWRFWGTDCKLLPEHKIFFREHRHFVDPVSKVCCDLVLMVQDIGDLNRTLKVVVEVSFRTTKIKTLGWSKTYRVEMWEGYKQTVRGRVAVENKRYDSTIFPLYSSYHGGSGKEIQVDGRQNVLKSPKLWILAALVVALFAWGLYTAIGFFTASGYKDKTATVAKGGTAAVRVTGNVRVAATQRPALPEDSPRWRLVGRVRFVDAGQVVVADDSGRLRFEHPSSFQFGGTAMVGEVDGQRVAIWTGRLPGPSK
jgi:zona occludens toxin